MQQAEINHFLREFFTEHHCPILEHSPSSFDVQLTTDMDKALMNRPFYWHYIEKIGAVPSPMKLSFHTNPSESSNKKKGEFIHYGSPRLHQLFKIATERGKYGHFYENVPQQKNPLSLKPWICINGKIIYHCHRKKERIFSIGLSLVTGEMINDFHFQIDDWDMVEVIPTLCFKLTPLIKPASGIERIRNYLLKGINNENHAWAQEAREKMEEELTLLERFYEDISPKPTSYYTERAAIIEQYDPVIDLSIVSGGLFFLDTHPLLTQPSKKP